MVKLLTVQEALDEVDLAALLTEATFLATVDLHPEALGVGLADFVLVNATALHLALHFDMEAALHFASGPPWSGAAPLYAACALGNKAMAKMLIQYGASVN